MNRKPQANRLACSSTAFLSTVRLLCGRKHHCYKTTSAWNEATVTWNTGRPTYDNTVDYANNGAGYQVPDIAPSNDEWPPQPFYIDITNLLTFWINNPASNYGGYMTAGPHSVDLTFYSDGYQGNTRNPIIVGILQ